MTPGVDTNGKTADGSLIVKRVDAGTDAVEAVRLVCATAVALDDDSNKVAAGAKEDDVVGGLLVLTAGARLDVAFCSGVNKIYVPVYGCDITARTVLLYVLFCLICMYCPLYVLHILHTVHTVHVPYFPVSDVEVSPSTSVHTLVHTLSHSHSVTLHLTKHHSYSLSC